MIASSLDAVRQVLHDAYPDYRIYVNDVPQGFERPSFFVYLTGAPVTAMAADLRGVRITWQIVYFPPVLDPATGTADHFDLYAVHDRLQTLFGEAMYLTAPDGHVLDVENFDGAPRDDEGYYTLRLDAQRRIRRKENAPIQNVTLDLNKQEDGI